MQTHGVLEDLDVLGRDGDLLRGVLEGGGSRHLLGAQHKRCQRTDIVESTQAPFPNLCLHLGTDCKGLGKREVVV